MAVKDRHVMTARLLGQLQDAERVFIFDNGSQIQFPGSVLRVEATVYAMWNEGLREAASAADGAPHNVAVLNNDLEVPPGFLAKLARGLRQRDSFWIAYPNFEGLDIPDGVALPVSVREGGHLSGWAFMLRGEAGLEFDEQFEWWYGDDDIQRQVEASGRQVVCVGGATCVHLEPGHSTDASPILLAKAEADRTRFERKWDGPGQGRASPSPRPAVRRERPARAARGGPSWGGAAEGGTPMISVVIPAYNAAATIEEQLEALAGEEAEVPWEVIVADNGSTDGTRARVAAWADRLPDLRVVDAGQRRGAAHARNVGVAAARGARVLLCDADDVVGPGWVGHLGAALIDHPLVCGLVHRAELNPQFAALWRDRAPVIGPRMQHDHLPFAPSGNLGFRRELFDALQGFDESLRRGEDTDFSWRALGVGTALHLVPEAIVYIRLPETPSGWLRRGYVDGVSTVQLYLHHRASGMQRPPARQALRAYAELVRDVSKIWQDRPAVCSWAYDLGIRAGRLAGSVRHRTLFV